MLFHVILALKKLVVFIFYSKTFYFSTFLGSRQESQLPSVSQKCQAFCAAGTDQVPTHQQQSTLVTTTVTPKQLFESKTNLMGNQLSSSSCSTAAATFPQDEEEDMTAEDVCPDLSNIIRSLDTPPPSS